MRKKIDRLKKYVISRASFILTCIVFIISLVCYCLLNISGIGESFIPDGYIKQVVINGFLVITSVTGTNLLTSLIIEKNSKNQEWRNIILQDVLSNCAFYNYMDYNTRNDIYAALTCSINGCNDDVIQNEIMPSVLNKLNFENADFYFEKCSYDVTCKITDQYIEYHTTRVTEIYSHKEQYIINKYRVAIVAGLCDNGLGISGIKIKLNGVSLKEDEYIIETDCPDKEADIRRNEYNDIKYIYLKNPLHLHSNNGERRRAITMVYEYTARSSLNDIVSSYRASRPCKRFAVKFTLLTHDDYKLLAHTFGFIDSSKAEEDTDNNYTSYSEFRDWIFEDDGVVITIVPK